MTKIKFCGLTGDCDIDAANELRPEYVGFVFAPKSKRYVTPERAAELKRRLAVLVRQAKAVREFDFSVFRDVRQLFRQVVQRICERSINRIRNKFRNLDLLRHLRNLCRRRLPDG